MFDYTIEDNIVIFYFNNGKTNSITLEALQGMEMLIDRVNSESDLKGIVFTGSDKCFSSGFDLGTFTSFANNQAIVDWFKIEEEVLYKLFTCSKPVIAAINGHVTAAGMIVALACDYRLVLNNPRIKVGMTEIKIGLSLTPTQGEIMLFGLDTDKNYRDVIFGGELFAPADAVNKEIFDELVYDPSELISKAKAKVCAMIDTPGQPFIRLKLIQRRQRAQIIRASIDSFDWNTLVETFTNPEILQTLTMIKQAIG